MKHKILLVTAFLFALIAVIGLTKLVLADSADTLLPISDGEYRQWLLSDPNSSTPNHYEMVDESLCNGDEDYNYARFNAIDSYVVDLSSVPNSSIINSISITPCASVDQIDPNFIPGIPTTTPIQTSLMRVFYRINGINYPDTELWSINDYTLVATSNIPTLLHTSKFGGLAIFKGSNTTLQAGVRLMPNSKPGVRLSQIITSISYTYIPSSTPTVGATSVVSTTRTSTNFYAYVNPNGTSTTGWFRYGSTSPGTCNDTFGTKVPSPAGVNLGAGSSPVQYFYYNAPVSPDTIYYYCAIAENASGKSFGTLKSFKTPL